MGELWPPNMSFDGQGLPPNLVRAGPFGRSPAFFLFDGLWRDFLLGKGKKKIWE